MTATDLAYGFAKERILDGRFRGGELLSEGDVANEVGLSRTPVREAFLRLEAEGFLRLYPRRGAFVVPVSDAEVEDVMETRQLVEQHAVRRIVELGVDVIGELRALIAEQRQRAKAGDLRGFVEADREFHRVIVNASGNAVLVTLHDSLRDRQSRMGQAAIARDAGRIQQIVDEHERLVAAIAARDADAARECVEKHLDGTLALLRSQPRSGGWS